MSSQSPIARIYLFFYNIISSLLWLRILLTLLTSLSTSPSNPTLPTSPYLYTTLEPQTRWTQTIAAIEILHAASGTKPPTHIHTFYTAQSNNPRPNPLPRLHNIHPDLRAQRASVGNQLCFSLCDGEIACVPGYAPRVVCGGRSAVFLFYGLVGWVFCTGGVEVDEVRALLHSP